MSIYHGSSEIEDIYIGSVKIGRVYKGNTLVYESAKKMPIYGYGSNKYILGSNSVSGVVVEGLLDTITAITGTLGQSGSSVTISSDNSDMDGSEFPYYDTISFNGVRLHIYAEIFLLGQIFRAAYVLEDAKTGSKCLHWQGKTFYPDDTEHIRYYPLYVTETEMRYSNTEYIHTRVAANDTNYTKKGFKS